MDFHIFLQFSLDGKKLESQNWGRILNLKTLIKKERESRKFQCGKWLDEEGDRYITFEEKKKELLFCK